METSNQLEQQSLTIRTKVFWVIGWTAILAPAFWIFPSGDDWGTAAPIVSGGWSGLRPTIFWRPLEYLFRRFLGTAPVLFPALNYLLTVVGHGLSGLMVFKLLCRFSVGQRIALVAATIALVVPGTNAAAWSTDSSIQTISTAIGLYATWTLYRDSKYRHWLWLVLVFIATLCKESAIGWFFAAPLLAHYLVALYSDKTSFSAKLLYKLLGMGLLAILVYFGIRTALAVTPVQLGADAGRYSLTLNPLILTKNFARLIGASITSGSTLAAFALPRQLGILIVTALAGVPILILAARGVFGLRLRALQLAIIIGFLAGPHLLLSHVSEMYAHPMIMVLVLTLTLILHASEIRPVLIKIAVIAFVLGSLVTWVHKFSAMYQSGERSRAVAEKLAAAWEGSELPDKICTVEPENDSYGHYSVFKRSPYAASGWGRSVYTIWGFDSKVEFVKSKSTEECRQHNPSATITFDPETVYVERH